MKKVLEDELRKELKEDYINYSKEKDYFKNIKLKWILIILGTATTFIIASAIYFTDINIAKRGIKELTKTEYKEKDIIDFGENKSVIYTNDISADILVTSSKEEKGLEIQKADGKLTYSTFQMEDSILKLNCHMEGKVCLKPSKEIKKINLEIFIPIEKYVVHQLETDNITMPATNLGIINDSKIGNLKVENRKRNVKTIVINSKIDTLNSSTKENTLHIIKSDIKSLNLTMQKVSYIIIEPLKNQSIYINNKLVKKAKGEEKMKMHINVRKIYEQDIKIK